MLPRDRPASASPRPLAPDNHCRMIGRLHPRFFHSLAFWHDLARPASVLPRAFLPTSLSPFALRYVISVFLALATFPSPDPTPSPIPASRRNQPML
ncbi:uncharacterized protein BJ171DRAFT_462522 [Polychytrium aggregatum]|uniref:uncharacterized protein n=1 Tax=Polychytrium aggregatum TaxID=110093 RepID=UPI0022FE59CA|nr:uncharacterized protein BJ171DRAFT_462522 [Polychytrium aggregatum]KAI9199390.1 hypothetical protein BJ171DRAFT_462522 [Polychytrium aggregatum]